MSELSMRTIPVKEAVGSILCHDITRIEPGKSKGPVFRKGHIVTEEDIPILLNVGKENLYVYTPTPGFLHENDAAMRIANAVSGQNLKFSEIKEGRINFISAIHGLLRINVDLLDQINDCDNIVLSTFHTMQETVENEAVGGTRVIPLIIEEKAIERVEKIAVSPVIEVLPFKQAKIGIVTTGNEVYSGRIKDAFGPVLQKKFEHLGSTILGQSFSDDSVEMTVAAIKTFIDQGVDMIACTGGMSVDPDDRTPMAIRTAGGEIVTYGAPTFPGAMFLLAYIGDIPILGLPGCVMYHKTSIFDLIVPRLLAGVTVTRKDITSLGHGGFCANCEVCRYPLCSFGKN